MLVRGQNIQGETGMVSIKSKPAVPLAGKPWRE
jgi:hypothetical protein